MQIFILGKTKTGKSTLANLIKESNYTIYEAGSWAREEYLKEYPQNYDEFSTEFKNNLTNYALSKLKQDHHYSFKKYKEFININKGNTLIVGVRNPDDFINMLQKDDIVIFINSNKQFNGTLELFEKGLAIIKDYINWKSLLGIKIPTIEIDEDQIDNTEYLKTLLKDIL